MKKIAWLVWSVCALAGAFAGPDLKELFLNPPKAARPWCYWWWQNGHADEASITADLEAMKAAGFGGLLFSDSMGYWDDEDHVLLPPREIAVMSPEWRRLVQHAIRECARLGLVFTMNTATSGGKLCGPWKVGPDAPKRLMCRVLPPGETAAKPDFPFWREVDTIAVAASPEEADKLVAKGWFEAGDGTRTQHAGVKNKSEKRTWIPSREPARAAPGDKVYTLVFGSTTIPGHETDVDVLDPKAVTAHFNRFCGAVMDDAGADLVGRDKTFAGVYSVSWEGVVPSWSPTFAEEYEACRGWDVRFELPLLAGFAPEGVTDPDKRMRFFRWFRNELFRRNFYGTLAKLAHARGVMMYSENGGPWNRAPEIFREADQLKFYAENDMPQGEFWVNEDGTSVRMFAPDDLVDRFFMRGAVSAAHVYGKPLVSMESFTHMRRHWSMSPSTLKKAIDKVFADGANHVVWHTFSLSPARLGVPGVEYFAGTHINPNVTWHKDARAFVDYLARCEALLQVGEPVVDVAVKAGRTPYAGWERLRGGLPGDASVPAGYNYDLVNDEAWAKSRVVDGWRIFPSGMRYPAERPSKPDLEGPFAFAHRRTAETDVYFVQGEAKGRAIFRVPSGGVDREHAVYLFDPVTGDIRPVLSVPTNDGRTEAYLDLTESGSAFVVFARPHKWRAAHKMCLGIDLPVTNAWNVSFAYHRLDHARHLPPPMKIEKLFDWTTSENLDLRHFAGTARYETTFACNGANEGAVRLGALPSGTARVFVNGVDCGVVWCAPWEVPLPPGTVRKGENRLVVDYTNNWINRLIGDCDLAPDDRVTTSNLQLLKGGRVKPNGKKLNVYSGYCSEDALQPSGLLGPVRLFLR